jgi:hypothetical protein
LIELTWANGSRDPRVVVDGRDVTDRCVEVAHRPGGVAIVSLSRPGESGQPMVVDGKLLLDQCEGPYRVR